MATATDTPTTTKAAKGFKVICPECGDAEGTVTIDLNDLRQWARE